MYVKKLPKQRSYEKFVCKNVDEIDGRLDNDAALEYSNLSNLRQNQKSGILNYEQRVFHEKSF